MSQFNGNAASGNCQATACTVSNTTWCCQDQWPVVDGGVMVGWLTKIAFEWTAAKPYVYDTFGVHYYATSNPNATSGGSSSAAAYQSGVCINCVGNEPTPVGLAAGWGCAAAPGLAAGRAACDGPSGALS